jgi:hypothetical protein
LLQEILDCITASEKVEKDVLKAVWMSKDSDAALAGAKLPGGVGSKSESSTISENEGRFAAAESNAVEKDQETFKTGAEKEAPTFSVKEPTFPGLVISTRRLLSKRKKKPYFWKRGSNTSAANTRTFYATQQRRPLLSRRLTASSRGKASGNTMRRQRLAASVKRKRKNIRTRTPLSTASSRVPAYVDRGDEVQDSDSALPDAIIEWTGNEPDFRRMSQNVTVVLESETQLENARKNETLLASELTMSAVDGSPNPPADSPHVSGGSSQRKSTSLYRSTDVPHAVNASTFDSSKETKRDTSELDGEVVDKSAKSAVALPEVSGGSSKRKSTSLYRSNAASQEAVDESTVGSLKGSTSELGGDGSMLLGDTLPALTSDAVNKGSRAQNDSEPEAVNAPTEADKSGNGPHTSASRIALVRSRDRLKGRLYEKKPQTATTPHWVLRRLHRKRAVHHTEEELDLQDYGEDTVLLRMAVRHLLHLSLLTNNAELIKNMYGAFVRTMHPKKLPRLERQARDPKNTDD